MFDNIIIMDELIEEAYEETNYGQIEKIYKYLNIHHKEAEITRSDIKVMVI